MPVSQLLSQPMNACPSLICSPYCPTAHVLPSRPFPREGAGKTRDFHSVVRTCSPFLEILPSTLPFRHQIVLESFVALSLGIIGACLKTPPLKEITWAIEMKTRCTPTISLFAFHNAASASRHLAICACRKIDDMGARMGFANFVTLGRVLGKYAAPSS